jgi:hypothetical protein
MNYIWRFNVNPLSVEKFLIVVCSDDIALSMFFVAFLLAAMLTMCSLTVQQLDCFVCVLFVTFSFTFCIIFLATFCVFWQLFMQVFTYPKVSFDSWIIDPVRNCSPSFSVGLPRTTVQSHARWAYLKLNHIHLP